MSHVPAMNFFEVQRDIRDLSVREHILVEMTAHAVYVYSIDKTPVVGYVQSMADGAWYARDGSTFVWDVDSRCNPPVIVTDTCH